MIKGFLFAFGLVTLGATIGTFEATYTMKTTCVRAYDGIATFEDVTGNCWDWEIEEGEVFETGCSYKLVMDNNHTFEIEDDWIKKISKKF